MTSSDRSGDGLPAPVSLHYPYGTPPSESDVHEILPGVLWIRLRLPFRLNHVNVYMLAGDDGWTLIDTGFGNEETTESWERLFAGPLSSTRISRVIVTHAHPDHIGMAGWITRRFGSTLCMSQVEYLQGAYRQERNDPDRTLAQRSFFRRHGIEEGVADELLGKGQEYLKRVSRLPASFFRLANRDKIQIGQRRFDVITGGGHAYEQVMLYCADDRLFISAYQVLSKISPNISVWAVEPEADPLGDYIDSLEHISSIVRDEVLVLPGHGIPFVGLKARIKQLIDHHADRCRLIENACNRVSCSSADLISTIFEHALEDAHQLGFAAGEVVAHVNYLLGRQRLTALDQGVLRFVTKKT